MIQSQHFFQIGLGSMGKRRIRNLLFQKINRNQISGFDISESRRKEVEDLFGIRTFSSFKEAVAKNNPDIFIISTPPNLHSKFFLYAAEHNKDFFCEISSSAKGYARLFTLLKKRSVVAAPSCTFRFYQPIKKIREYIKKNFLGNVLTFSYHMGQYLPDWHPWEDYRKVYFSKRVSGAIREMLPFELSWLSWLLDTPVKNIKGVKGHISNLDIAAEDAAVACLQMGSNCIGTMLIDVLARFPRRHLYIVGSKGSLEWDWMKNVINLYQVSSKKWTTYALAKMEPHPGYITSEKMYQEEMKSFLLALQGIKKFPYTFAEDYYNQLLSSRITTQTHADNQDR